MPASTNGVIFGELRRIPLPRTTVNSSEKRTLDDLQVDLAEAAFDLYAEGDVRFAEGGVDV